MVDSLVTIALEKLTAILQDEAVLLVCVKKELQRLRRRFEYIQAVLKDAEDRRTRDDAVGKWLDELKDVAYEMDDILDEWATEDLKSKATEADGSRFDMKVSCLLSPITCFNRVQFRHNIGNRLKDARERLDDIAKIARDLRLIADIGEIRREENAFRMQEIRGRETGSLVDESSIVGRDDDVEKIVGQLLSESSQAANEVPIVVSIVGLGGVGKTTLAQLAHNSEKLKEHFHVKLWKCVSEDFDVQRVTESILKSASKGSGSSDLNDMQNKLREATSIGSGSSDLNDMQNKLREAIRGKRFLLVLDDIWSKDRVEWDKLILPLKSGAPGSRIVITTRDEGVAQIMGSTHIHRLELLSENDCWSLFRSRAFENRSEEECRELEEIGRKIVKKCKGLPLAVKTLGSAMCVKKTKWEWERILESETWNSEEVLGGILPALLLSYRHLPSPMKQCFTYCSLFPKDWWIEKNKVVKLWVAQGFIISGGSGDAEKIGRQYFDDLVRRSLLLREAEMDDVGGIYGCKMHDLVHDLARYVAKGEYSIVENERPSQDLTKSRHSSWLPSEEETSIPDAFHKAKNLRTFLLLRKSSITWSSISMVPQNFFHHLRCLRALDLSGSGIKDLPPAIKNLKHLRYLNLSFSKIEELPETVSSLCNLQTLNLRWCGSLCKLPQGVSQMINLEHLQIENSDLKYLPRGIGKLRQLRTLDWFVVNGREGCDLRELKHLNLLRGRLIIVGLEKASGSDEAVEAELDKKQGLQELCLWWNTGEVDEVNMMRTDSILQALRPPHTHLEFLEIVGYPGSKLPDWMEDPQFKNLVRVDLTNCCKCKQLPGLGKLPFLKYCMIEGMREVIHMDSEFCGDNAGGNGGSVSFPILEELVVADWPNWEGLELTSEISLMPSLHRLRIHNCPKLKKFLPNTPLWNLQILSLSGDNNRLFLEGLLPTLPNLYCLMIVGNKELTSIAGGWLGQLKSLHILILSFCSALESLPEELQSLRLQELAIVACPQLKDRCKEGGEDWHKISHIPTVAYEDFIVFGFPWMLYLMLMPV